MLFLKKFLVLSLAGTSYVLVGAQHAHSKGYIEHKINQYFNPDYSGPQAESVRRAWTPTGDRTAFIGDVEVYKRHVQMQSSKKSGSGGSVSSSISPDSGSVGAVEIKPKEEEEDQEPRDYLAYLKDIYEAGSMQQAAHENDPEKYFQLGGPKLNSNDNGRSAGLGSSYTPEEIGEEGAKERKEEEERETAELLKLTNEQNPKFQVISTGLGPVIPAGYRLPQGYNDYTIVVQEVPPADIATDGTTVRPGSKAEETRGPPELVYEIKTGSASSLTARCCRYLSGMENIMLYWMLYLALQVI